MNTKQRSHRTTLAAVAASLALAAGAAHALATDGPVLPPVQQQAGVDFMTGGVDLDVARLLQTESSRWPVALQFAVKDTPVNSYLADVRVVVRDSRGNPVLETLSDGPFLLARLQPGRYAVDATFGGRTLHETVAVKAGTTARRIFLWPHEYLDREG